MLRVNIIIALLLSSIAHAQKPILISNPGTLEIATGLRPALTSDAMYFNAFHYRNGWQIFQYDGETLEQISSFKTKYQNKKVEELACGGGITSQVGVFQEDAIFHITGKTAKSGLYRTNGGHISKMISGMEHCSEPVVHDGKLYLEGIFADGETWVKRTIIVHEDWTISKGVKTPSSNGVQLASEIQNFGKEMIGTANGHLAKWTQKGYEQFLKEFVNVRNTFVLEDELYFAAQKSGQRAMALFRMDKNFNVTKHANIYPGEHMLRDQRPVVVGNMAYFAADADTKGIDLYRVTKDTLERIEELAHKKGYRSVQGMTYFSDQLFINVCGYDGDACDLMQYNGHTIVERDPDYLHNIRTTSVFKNELIYLASEMRHEELYTSHPILPPTAKNDTFRVFDFWQNGSTVGKIDAYDASGKIRFKIVGGNEQNAFGIDYFTGELTVTSSQGLHGRHDSPFNLKVQARNKEGATAIAEIHIDVVRGQQMDTRNLTETLMFFPDFARKRTLTTSRLPSGQVVQVYDVNFNMVDELKIKGNSILLGQYTPGIYLLNVKNDRNLYQKIELH